MSEEKQTKVKMTTEEVLKLTAQMIDNFKKMMEKQDEKIELLIKTAQKTTDIQSDIKSIKGGQVSNDGKDYNFFLNMVLDMAQMKAIHGSDEAIKARMDMFKTNIEALMKEYKIQELHCSFLKKI